MTKGEEKGEVPMNSVKILPLLLCVLLLVMVPITSAQAEMQSQEEDEVAILVGRISYIEGHLFRYDTDQEEWVRTFKDAPFGVNDSLSSNKGGRAEIIMPNNTWMRMDGDSHIQLIILRDDLTEIEITSGTARFYNKGSYPVIKAGTPFGYVMAPAKTSFDLYVKDDSVEVIALEGTVYLTHDKTGERYEVIAESTSIIADNFKVSAGKAYGDSGWEAWNGNRDTLWAKRMDSRRKSARYLPPSLHDHTYVLDEYGVWERLYYDEGYYYFWRPLYVGAAWAPFTVGCWRVWHREHIWIPYEPFGYITHHYGNWVFIRGRWYWAPPVAHAGLYVGPPLLNIAFAWYPGRVAWIHFGVNIGWVPLAPYEPYYSYHRWGPKSVVIQNVTVTHINKNIQKYKNFRHAVIINKAHLHKVRNYRSYKNIHAKIASYLRHYRVTPLLRDTAMKNHRNPSQRYNFAKSDVPRKLPHSLAKKIKHNQFARNKRTTLSMKPAQKHIQHITANNSEKSAGIRPQKAKRRMSQIPKAIITKLRTRLANRSPKPGAHLGVKDRLHASMGIEPRLRKELPRPVTQKNSRSENHRFDRSKLEKRLQERHSKPANAGTFSRNDKGLDRKRMNERFSPGLKAQPRSRQARVKANQNQSHRVRQSIKNEGQLRCGKIAACSRLLNHGGVPKPVSPRSRRSNSKQWRR